jgi:DNA-binding NtrC family response regulator
MREKPTVLVVDRESDATRALIAFLRERDLEVVWAHDGEGAFHALDETHVDCLVTELRVHRIQGLAVLRHAIERNPDVCAVVVTAGRDVATAVEAMRQGAYDFQVKPLHLEKLLAVLRRGLSHQRLVARVAEMEETLDQRFGPDALTGGSRAIARISEQIQHIASTRATVLIEGEAGTGKSRVARSIHRNSPRKDERFVWVNLGALTEDVIESELFGHEAGSFPGATTPRRGRFELAEGGTLFLDEVSEAPPAVQVKLLRVLQDREFERLGGQEAHPVDARILTATDRDLETEVAAGRFRADLFHRLSVARIALPPLRERREDIPLLVETFIREHGREHGRRVTGITRGALERLMRHDWPGNVRELRNTVEGMVVFAEGKRPLDLSDLPPRLRDVEGAGETLRVAVGMRVEEVERQLIESTLRHTGGDKPRAAAMLGIGLRTLYRKLQRYGLR